MLRQVFDRVRGRLDQIRVDLAHVTLRDRRYAEEVTQQVGQAIDMVDYLENIFLHHRQGCDPPKYENLTHVGFWQKFFHANIVELPLDHYDTELQWFSGKNLSTSNRRGRGAMEKVWRELGQQGNRDCAMWIRISRKVVQYLTQVDRIVPVYTAKKEYSSVVTTERFDHEDQSTTSSREKPVGPQVAPQDQGPVGQATTRVTEPQGLDRRGNTLDGGQEDRDPRRSTQPFAQDLQLV